MFLRIYSDLKRVLIDMVEERRRLPEKKAEQV